MPPRACPTCLSLAEPSALYCQYCGQRLPDNSHPESLRLDSDEYIRCPACAGIIFPGELFCQMCGVILAPITGQPPPVPSRLSCPEKLPTPTGNMPGGEPIKPRVRLNENSEPDFPASMPGYFQGETGRIYAFPPEINRLLIGRSDIAEGYFPDIDLDSLGGEQSGISRRHALLTYHQDHAYLQDLNSTNYTFLNHRVLAPGQPSLLKDGDIIQFGQLVLVYKEKP